MRFPGRLQLRDEVAKAGVAVETAILDGKVDLAQVHGDDAAGADIGWRPRNCHLAPGQADIGTKGHQRRIRTFAHQPVEIRRIRLIRGALFGAVGNAPSIEDAKDDGFGVGHG